MAAGRPVDAADFRVRGVAAGAKVIKIAVPFSFRWATDAMSDPARASLSTVITVHWLSRFSMAPAHFDASSAARDAIFADVAVRASRLLARDIFSRFAFAVTTFSSRTQAGCPPRILERGRNSIETIVRTTIDGGSDNCRFHSILTVSLYQFDSLRRRDELDDHCLYGIHRRGNELADRHPAGNERERYPSKIPRRWMACSTSRRSSITMPRRARRRATTNPCPL